MKKKLTLVLITLALLLGITVSGFADISKDVGAVVRSFPEIVVVNTNTGCTANYFEAAGRWRVWTSDGEQVFQGIEGDAMHALLFACP